MAENKVTVQNADEQQTAASQHNKKITCGLVMPISSNDCGTEQHWLNVQKIIHDGLLPLDMNIRMVSHSDEVNIIQKNIVRNLFSDDIIICDVSSRNPNVMFELGIRLTFDKPVVIIKDKETPFVFDVGGIYHLEYPRSLNYVDILSFQESLCEKVKATLLASKDENYSPFLSNFTIAIEKKNELSTKEFERDEYLRLQVDELKEMFKIVLSRLPENPIARRHGLTIGGNPVNVMERRNESESVVNSYINKYASDIIGQIARNDELTKDASEIVKYCMKYFEENIPSAPDTIREQVVRIVLTNL